MECKKINVKPQVVLTLSWQEALDLTALADRTNKEAVVGFFIKSKGKNKEQVDRIDFLLEDISEAFDEEGVGE